MRLYKGSTSGFKTPKPSFSKIKGGFSKMPKIKSGAIKLKGIKAVKMPKGRAGKVGKLKI